MQKLYGLIVVLALLVVAPACAPPPPNLTPQANQAFTNMRIQRALDTIRDIVQDGNAQVPPVFTTATARTVTLWHTSAITVVHTLGQGWQTTLLASLDGVLANLSPNDRAIIGPYVALAVTIIQGVVS